MAYTKIHKMGDYAVCSYDTTDNLYVYTYDKEQQKSFYRTLGTTDLEAAIAAVRSLVERGITGDPKDALVQRPLRTVTEVLEFHRPKAEAQASAEFNIIAIERMKRLMGGSMLQHMVPSTFESFRDAAMAEGIVLSSVDRTLRSFARPAPWRSASVACRDIMCRRCPISAPRMICARRLPRVA